MLSKLEIKLSGIKDGDINYNMSSLFHGVIMELLPEDYVEYLHSTSLNPYTQYLQHKNDNWYWVVTTLNTEAYEKIIEGVLLKTKEIYVKKADLRIKLSEKNLINIEKKDILEEFYKREASKYIEINFMTPTSFKQSGRYSFYPDIRCIYQSLINKYNSSNDLDVACDEDTLEQLLMDTDIVKYNIRSTKFYLDKGKIPGFIGKVTFKFSGNNTMTNFANMLFKFGEFSGVGAKASLGMGAIRIIERGEKDGRTTD